MAVGVLSQRVYLPFGRPACNALKARHAGYRRGGRGSLVTRASSEFDLSQYTEAVVSEVRATEKNGHIVLLRLKGDTPTLLPVYIGESECAALVKEIHQKTAVRPLTHDLFKNSLEALGFRVTKVRITALVGNTYHARVHYARAARKGQQAAAADDGLPSEVDVDARPSDAVNLAVRFGAAIYVNKDVASKMGTPVHLFDPEHQGSNGSGENHNEVVRSCREEIMGYNDPTIMHKLQMQLAIAEERFEDATALRDVIDKILASDRALSLVVAMETALEDGRFEEASRLRDEFKALRQAQRLSSSEISEL